MKLLLPVVPPPSALLGPASSSGAPSLASGAGRTQDLPDWENPQVVGINKLDPHAPVYPFADDAAAAWRSTARGRPTTGS